MPASPPLNTTYFPAHIVDLGVRGCCHDVAVALHRQLGWPIAAIWEAPILDEFSINPRPSMVHAVVLAPTGQAVDVEGATTVRDLVARVIPEWVAPDDHATRARYALEIHGTEAAWTRALEAAQWRELLPRDDRIAITAKTLATSDAFRDLLATLAATPRQAHAWQPTDTDGRTMSCLGCGTDVSAHDPDDTPGDRTARAESPCPGGRRLLPEAPHPPSPVADPRARGRRPRRSA